MTDRRALPAGMTPAAWPTPARMAAIMDAIRRGIERYRAEMERRERGKQKGEPQI